MENHGHQVRLERYAFCWRQGIDHPFPSMERVKRFRCRSCHMTVVPGVPNAGDGLTVQKEIEAFIVAAHFLGMPGFAIPRYMPSIDIAPEIMRISRATVYRVLQARKDDHAETMHLLHEEMLARPEQDSWRLLISSIAASLRLLEDEEKEELTRGALSSRRGEADPPDQEDSDLYSSAVLDSDDPRPDLFAAFRQTAVVVKKPKAMSSEKFRFGMSWISEYLGAIGNAGAFLAEDLTQLELCTVPSSTIILNTNDLRRPVRPGDPLVHEVMQLVAGLDTVRGEDCRQECYR